LDPGSGKTFYYKAATGETTWERPAAAAAGGLPEGWTEHVDPGSGKTFYYKAATGETSWDKPAAASKPAEGALPEGWTEHVDPGSGKTFYYKAATGETSWDRPAAAAAAASSSKPAPGALPDGWTEHTDPGTGKTFYYEAATGKTSWDRPSKPKEEKTRAASFDQVARSIGAFLDEAKASKASFTQQEEQALAAVLAQYGPNLKQGATETFTAVSAAAAKLLPLARTGAAMPPDALGELNNAVQACETRYAVPKSETIPPNLMSAQPGSKLYPGLVKKVETLCGRTIEQLEQRESDALKAMLTRGGAHPGFDAQKADLEARSKQMMQSLHQKHAPILGESDHVPVYKTLPAGAKAVSIMAWNVMEFPRAGRAPGQDPVIEGLVPLCDLVIKHLGRKDDRASLLEAMTSEAVIQQHSTQALNVVRDALEVRGMEVVLLQEVGGDMQAKLEELCRQRGWTSLFAAGNADPNKCDAIAGIISKMPFDEQMQVEFQEETSKKIRHFPAVRQGTAWLISCHVPLGKQTTEDQKQGVGVKLIQDMSQRFFRSGTVLIIGGDWNADVNGIKNKTADHIPYGCSQVSVFTDSQTTHGAAFPVDGMLCLQ